MKMLISNKHFLFLMLALLATFLHSSDAYAGLFGEQGPGKGGPGGGGGGGGRPNRGSKDDGHKGGGPGKGSADADDDGTDDEVPEEFGWMNFVCGSNTAYPFVDRVCAFAIEFLRAQIEDYLGGGEESEAAETTLTDDEGAESAVIMVDPATRKLRHHHYH